MSMTSPDSTGPKLRDEQRAAVMVQGVSVALSASAGCGKTTVLTERYLAELDREEGRALDRVVALTFTEKAARELKGRIRGRLLARLESGADRERAMDLIRGLDAAPISTFHQYCARLVRRFALELGLDPDFAVLDEDVAPLIREQAVEHALREHLDQKNEDLIDLACRHRLGTVRGALVSLIESPADLEEWSQLDPDQIVERWCQARDETLLPHVIKRINNEMVFVRETLETIDSTNDNVNMLRANAIAAIDDLGAASPGARSMIERIELLKETLKVQSARKPNWPSEEDYERIKALFESSRKAIEKQIEPWKSESSENDLAAAREGLAFTRLAIDARTVYERFKQRRGGLDFDDLLTRALALLSAREADETGSRRRLLDVVLVDEFQDTDHIQSEVIEHLGARRFLSGRVFVVGDVKQSIYRFRGAKPTIFGEWRARFPAAGRLSLTESFRAGPGVTRFVNVLFRGCFSDLDRATAGDPGAYDLRPRRSVDPSEPAVEFVWTRCEEITGDAGAAATGQEGASAFERREAEAAVLARRVRERLDAGWLVLDKETRATRKARPGDIAYLFRAMTDIHPYERALMREGLDYYTVGGAAFYAQQEVRDMVNLIAYLEDPFDEVSLAGALRGPFFGLSDDAVYRLATQGGGLVEGFARFHETPDLPPDDRRRAERAATLVARWRGLKDHAPMARLLETILDESGYEGTLACEFLGDRKLANVRKLIRMARSFDRQGGFTLGALVARLGTLLDDGAREEQAPVTEENDVCVRLMTIHQAKGLEFPIVVVPDLTRGQSHRHEPVVFDRSLGVLVARGGDDPESGPGLGWVVHRALETMEDAAESLRLFYVATTRARDALILSGSFGGKRESSSPVWSFLTDRFDIETGLSRAMDGLEPLSVAVHTSAPLNAGAEPIAFGKLTPLDQIEQAILRADPPRRTAPAPRGALTRPSFVDLDATGELPLSERRIDRLMHAIVASNGWSRGESWETIRDRAGASIVPAASARVLEMAGARLGPWLESPLLRALKKAPPGAIQLGVALTASFPTPEGRPVALHGRCDLVFRGRDGIARGVVVVSSVVNPGRSRLLGWLLARTAPVWAEGAVGEPWLFEHGLDGRLAVVAPATDDAGELARDLDGLLFALG